MHPRGNGMGRLDVKRDRCAIPGPPDHYVRHRWRIPMSGAGNRHAKPSDPTPDRERPTPPSALLTIEQVARILQVNGRTVRRLLQRGELPWVRIGRQYRLEPAVLNAFIAARRHRMPF
jgi:excisionase family DNA binding protein